MRDRAYRLPSGSLVLDLQADLTDTPLRLAAPLEPVGRSAPPFSRLEPVLRVNGEPRILRMGQTLTVPRRLLAGEPVADLSADRWTITAAIDTLLSGF